MNQAEESVEVHRCRMDCCWGPSNHHGIIVGDPQVNVNLGWLGGTRACWCSLLIHLALQATEVHGIHRPAQPDPAPLGSSQDGKWHIFQAIKQQNLQQKYNKHLQTSTNITRSGHFSHRVSPEYPLGIAQGWVFPCITGCKRHGSFLHGMQPTKRW